jgi:hypothetical protein
MFIPRLCGAAAVGADPLCAPGLFSGPLQRSRTMDLVFIALGAGAFVLFAVYAVLLRRV